MNIEGTEKAGWGERMIWTVLRESIWKIKILRDIEKATWNLMTKPQKSYT